MLTALVLFLLLWITTCADSPRLFCLFLVWQLQNRLPCSPRHPPCFPLLQSNGFMPIIQERKGLRRAFLVIFEFPCKFLGRTQNESKRGQRENTSEWWASATRRLRTRSKNSARARSLSCSGAPHASLFDAQPANKQQQQANTTSSFLKS